MCITNDASDPGHITAAAAAAAAATAYETSSFFLRFLLYSLSS